MANSHNFVYLNNKLLRQEEALISIDERGFLFGDGLFETCLFINKQIINFQAHLTRLKIGLSSLKFNNKFDDIEKKCYELIKKNQLNDGIIRISISRGIGSKGYLPTNQSPNLTIIQTKNLPTIPTEASLISCNIKPSHFSFKSANALNYVLAKIFAEENNCYDAILCDDRDYICETSSANIFWIKDNMIFTPDNNCPMVRGTIRDLLLKIPQLKITLGKFKISELKKADEVFITNATIHILPIEKIIFPPKKINQHHHNILVKYNSKITNQIAKTLTQTIANIN